MVPIGIGLEQAVSSLDVDGENKLIPGICGMIVNVKPEIKPLTAASA